ncbi:lantern saccharopine dehydrogenase-like [Photinus pyralis]|uniref:Lantern saccharopine dehydrogenase-like n=3 Tax=Photinus pyralis TaxID=7054 RepID=A0A1Y1NJ82_PHOPY|nr:saccharopine dehydrogenase-like oxidoreductase [Photinus pyralis]KAB0798327.1 lantern saccharopine dehydrogenase-like [Photinus pyralis]
MSDRLDIILFGATGQTGKNCLKYLYRFTRANGRSLTWGIAGRSKAKLKQVLEECVPQTGPDLTQIPIIIADVNDNDSLNKMTSQARLIINCCGPFDVYGETVIIACLETGTHHVDVAGETFFMENMQYKYNRLAAQKGIYIISACGADSIPGDLGVVFLQQNFEGTLNSVETYLYLDEQEPKTPGPLLNFATWESAIEGIGKLPQISALRRKMFKKRIPVYEPRLPLRPQMYKSEVANAWLVPFLGADRAVINRTQRYFYEHENKRPVQVNPYEAIDSAASVQFINFYKNLILFLVKYKFGRKLLLSFPSFFTAGMFSFENPSDEKSERTSYDIVFHGVGWDENVSASDTSFRKPPNKSIIGHVSGMNPGYGLTCICVTMSAIVLLTEPENMPYEGGVYTPGVAFARTSLVKQLNENGVTFEIKSKM